MIELSTDEQIALRESQAIAFRQSAVAEAIQASSGPLSQFINAMNGVQRNYGGKLPDGIQHSWDRITQKDPADLKRVVDWLKSHFEVPDKPTNPGDDTNSTPQPPEEHDEASQTQQRSDD